MFEWGLPLASVVPVQGSVGFGEGKSQRREFPCVFHSFGGRIKRDTLGKLQAVTLGRWMSLKLAVLVTERGQGVCPLHLSALPVMTGREVTVSGGSLDPFFVCF